MATKKRTKNAKIFIRIFPSNDFCYENIKVETNFKVIYARSLQDFNSNIPRDDDEPKYWQFFTDGVFYNHSQQEIYSSVMDNVLKMALQGSDAVLFSYGQTGSGKTYTMSGLRNQYTDCGLAPRLLAEMFDVKKQRQEEMVINYKMSFVELVSSDLKDLLEKNPTFRASSHDVFKNVLSLPLTTEEVGLSLLFKGESQRSIAPSATYQGANLGHGILTIHVESTSIIRSRPLIANAKIHLIDMSGINSAGNSVAPWFSPKEQGQSNLTKTLLEQFIVKLNKSASGISMVSPQGTCPFIRYLGRSLSRKSNVRFIGHVHGSRSNLDLTLSTLRFGEIVNELKPHNLAFDITKELRLHQQNIEEELDMLTLQLDLSSMLVNESDWTNISQGRLEHLRRLIKSFLEGESSDRTVMAVQQSKLATILFKDHLDMVTVETNELAQKLLALKKEEEEENCSSSSSLVDTSNLSSHRQTPHGSRASKLQMVRKPPLTSKETILSVTSLGGVKAKGKGSRVPVVSEKLDGKVVSKNGGLKKGSIIGLRRASVKNDKTKESDKKLSRDSLSKRLAEVEKAIEPNVIESELPALPLLPVPSYTDAWKKFANSGLVNVNEMQAELEKAKLLTEQAKELYLKGVSEVKIARQMFEETRADLAAAQRARHLTGSEVYDLDGKVLTGDLEKKLSQLLKLREGEMNNKQETLKTLKLNMTECSMRSENMEVKIEDCFQEFCLAEFGAPSPSIETQSDESSQFVQTDTASEERRRHYNTLLEQVLLSKRK